MSSTPVANVSVGITADNRTAKGAKEAEKRLGAIPKHVSAVNKRWAGEADRSAIRATRGVLRTFAQVEQAGARAFGGRSMTSGLASRVGALREATSALGTGMGEAATAGGVLSGALTGVGVAAAGTIGIVAAAGYAAFKLADGWAQGAASIGRTAQTIGVASKALQEFTAAGERAGVDKGTSTGALGGIAQTLNDARYGRNQEAMALLMRLGVKMRTGPDGQLDTMGMTMDLSDALARQKNAQTRRMIASRFGISDAALPMFAGGSGALRADMTDADKTALVMSDGELEKGRRIARKGAIVGQMKDRAMGAAGSATADVTERGYDAAIDGGRGALSGSVSFGGVVRNQFAPAAAKIARAGDTMLGAASQLISGTAIAAVPGGRMGRSQIVSSAARGQRLRAKFEAMGLSREEAAAWAANAVAESGGDFRSRQPGGVGRGLFQWGSPNPKGDRRQDFRRLFGHSIDRSTEDEQLRFWMWERGHTFAHAQRHIDAAHGAAAKAAAITKYYEGPKSLDRDAADRARIAAEMVGQIPSIPVKVEVTILHGPPGSRAKVRAGHRMPPAVSHATVGH